MKEGYTLEAEKFRTELLKDLYENMSILQTTDKNDWTVKGFIDVFKNIYTISVDTKVVSKILELMLFPTICIFAKKHNLKMELARHQNHYPDISFICPDGNTYALDIKSTYRTQKNKVNGFTLGAFTGYFRNRDSSKNITMTYNYYTKHFVLGIMYSKQDDLIDEKRIYTIDDLGEILSVVSNFEFLLQEKYKIATSRPGSGNTKNIGSLTDIGKLTKGEGPFSQLGVEIFDDYWMYYLTKDMAHDSKVPYSNLKEYAEYKKIAPDLEIIEQIDDDDEPVSEDAD